LEKPHRRLLDRRALALPLSALLWAADVLIVIAWTPLVAAFRLATFRSDPVRRRVERVQRGSAVLAVRINPFWDFRIAGAGSLDANRPLLFVANHKSLADVFLLCLLPWQMKFLSKESIFRIPLLGWQMRTVGDISLSRGDRESAKEALDLMRRRFQDGSSVVVFPEGTRSADGALAPFREGAFRLAIEAGIDIVPLAVRGTETALPKHSLLFRPTTASVTVLPPVTTSGLTAMDAPELAERVRGEIARALERRAPEVE
jgi:1-acyl-sn-glycerol-3-phosphate acyltransferase